jgi:hypothetical protein
LPCKTSIKEGYPSSNTTVASYTAFTEKYNIYINMCTTPFKCMHACYKLCEIVEYEVCALGF